MVLAIVRTTIKRSVQAIKVPSMDQVIRRRSVRGFVKRRPAMVKMKVKMAPR